MHYKPRGHCLEKLIIIRGYRSDRLYFNAIEKLFKQDYYVLLSKTQAAKNVVFENTDTGCLVMGKVINKLYSLQKTSKLRKLSEGIEFKCAL